MNKKEIQNSRLHKFLRKHGMVSKFKAEMLKDEDGMTYEQWVAMASENKDAVWGGFVFPNPIEEFEMWAKLAHKYEDEFNAE